MATSAEIGIRVYLDDAASAGLGNVSGLLGDIGRQALGAHGAMAGLSQQMAMLGVAGGFALSLVAVGAAIKYSVDSASEFEQALFSVAVATHVPLETAKAYSTELMNLAANSTFTSTEIANGIALLGRSGYQLPEIMNNMADAGIALGIATRSTAIDGFGMLSQAMSVYHLKSTDAMHTADLLQFAFEHQRGSVSELESGLSQVTPSAAQANTSLREIVAALDVVGPSMKSTSMAGTALRYAIDNVLKPTAGAKAELIKLGLASYDAGGNFHSAFFDAKGNAKDLTQILQILHDKMKGMSQEDQFTALKNIFSVRGGQGVNILLDQFSKYMAYIDQLNKTNDNAGLAMKRWQEVMGTFAGAWAGLTSSIRDFGVIVGNQLLPYLTDAINRFNGWLSGVRNTLAVNPSLITSFLKLSVGVAGLGLVLSIAAMAFMGILPPVFIMIGIMLAVSAATFGVVIAIQRLVAWFKNTHDEANPVLTTVKFLVAEFLGLATFLRAQVAQSIKLVSDLFRVMGIDSGTLMFALKALGAIVGVVLVIALGLVIGVLRGLIAGLAMFLVGVVLVVGGVSRVIQGIVMVLGGLLGLITGLFTHNQDMINKSWDQLWHGLLAIVQGIGSLLMGVVLGTLGAIIIAVIHFVLGVIGYFGHLANVLVGNSIVPDMMRAIHAVVTSFLSLILSAIIGFVSGVIAHFLQLASQVISVGTSAWNGFHNAVASGINAVMGLVASLPGRVMGALAGLAGMLFNSGATAMQMFANGLTSTLGAVVSAVANAAGQVANFLAHHSPAKMGPLADDDQWMPRMMNMMAQGIHSNIPLLTSAASAAAGGIASAPSTARLATPSPGVGAAGATGSTTVNLVLDGTVLGTAVINHVTGQMQLNGLGRAFR